MGISAVDVVSATADTRALTHGALPGTSLTSRLTHRGGMFTPFSKKG